MPNLFLKAALNAFCHLIIQSQDRKVFRNMDTVAIVDPDLNIVTLGTGGIGIFIFAKFKGPGAVTPSNVIKNI